MMLKIRLSIYIYDSILSRPQRYKNLCMRENYRRNKFGGGKNMSYNLCVRQFLRVFKNFLRIWKNIFVLLFHSKNNCSLCFR